MTATCTDCGREFEVAADLAARYPGWTPKQCPRCYRAARGGGGAVEELRTTAEVLARHHGGPDDGVFTDGSAIPNPGPGGWGAVYVRDGEIVAQAHGHKAATTNNEMELTAIIHGFDLVPPGTAVTLYSDSNLAVRTINEWAAGWEARGWRRKGGPIANLELVKEAYRRHVERPEITISWIKAHSGNRWNEYADALATAWLRDEV